MLPKTIPSISPKRGDKVKQLIITIILLLISVAPVASGTCFLVGEVISGKNKKCYYDCVGGNVAITVGEVDKCPLTIDY